MTYDAWSEIDMLSWISRGTLELVAQAALGGTLDPLEDDRPGEYGQAMKLLLYVQGWRRDLI